MTLGKKGYIPHVLHTLVGFKNSVASVKIKEEYRIGARNTRIFATFRTDRF